MIEPWAFGLKCPFGMISMHPTDDRISQRSWLTIRAGWPIRYDRRKLFFAVPPRCC